MRKTVVKVSSKGRLYLDWEPMPRIPDEYLECVVYLYPSIPAAESGEQVGGTGFVVEVPSENDVLNKFYYIVTNKHVIDRGNTTVRFNTPERRHEAFEYDERHWFRSRNADLAIYLLPDPNPQSLDFRPIAIDKFVTRERIATHDIGIGDEVFFAGRFINAEGKDRNRPSLRFGTIAQVNTDVIDGEESFLVEARSIPGYSGSPVFVFALAGTTRGIVASAYNPGVGPWLLGVDWSHINDYVGARDDKGNDLPFKIQSNSGMMGVVPVWKLEELLFRPDVKSQRKSHPRNVRSATPDAASGGAASHDISLPATDENPTHREDFTRLVDVAARKQPQGD